MVVKGKTSGCPQVISIHIVYHSTNRVPTPVEQNRDPSLFEAPPSLLQIQSTLLMGCPFETSNPYTSYIFVWYPDAIENDSK